MPKWLFPEIDFESGFNACDRDCRGPNFSRHGSRECRAAEVGLAGHEANAILIRQLLDSFDDKQEMYGGWRRFLKGRWEVVFQTMVGWVAKLLGSHLEPALKSVQPLPTGVANMQHSSELGVWG